MNILEALILGIVQGISEFLPVSSSGHLSIFSEFLNLNDVPILFDILLHIATLASVLIVFRKRIGSLFVSLFKFTAWHMKRINKKPAETGKRQEEATFLFYLWYYILFLHIFQGFCGKYAACFYFLPVHSNGNYPGFIRKNESG